MKTKIYIVRDIFRIVTLLTAFVFIACSCSKETKRDISQKEIFTAGFPRIISFRADGVGIREGYEFWENYHIHYNGITKKLLNEEINANPLSAELANKYAENHPEKLLFLHFNGEARNVSDKETHETYFPGHWVYEAGSFLDEDISESQTTFRVKSAKPFLVEAIRIIRSNKAVGTRPHNIIIVPVDQSGNKLWYESEYATIDTVDYEHNIITVKRGEFFSVPRSYVRDKTYIAPLAAWGWAGSLQWTYNLSTACPEDKNGNTCSDVLLNQIKEWYGPEGILKNIDGIGFDVNYFMATQHPKWDCNNDGIADGGVIDGKSIYRLGDWDFLKSLRKHFGPEFIIVADGWKDESQRAVGVLNGMESEGLCKPNDGYRQISRTLNQQTYWNMHNNTKYKLSYITSKYNSTVDATYSQQLTRMGMGVATCLGVGYTAGRQPEVTGGTLNKYNWLGVPVTDMIYPAEETPDLLNGAGIEMSNDLVGKFDFSNAVYRVKDNTLYIKGKAKQSNPYANLSIPGPEIILPPDGDLIIFLEAKAIDGYFDFRPEDRVPRKINIKINGTPSYTLPGETEQAIAMHNDLAGFMGTPDFTPLNFYFRKVGREGIPVKLTIEVEEQGEFAIRNLTVHSAPLTLAREFENGVVLVNTSFDDYDFNLEKLFKEGNRYQRIKAVEPDQGRQGRNTQEVPDYNNGEDITSVSKVTVPGLNALFLIKKNN